MSNHVRDPKYFEKMEKSYLVLGARDKNDYYCLVVPMIKTRSTHYKTIYSEKNLGFMWNVQDYLK